ncbi:hypothetical protein EBB07_09255 [Paenibacillaceae bacterium]|nr:hypothetical protein EBB07_09255 [Paenibacillaceae bacterium]
MLSLVIILAGVAILCAIVAGFDPERMEGRKPLAMPICFKLLMASPLHTPIMPVLPPSGPIGRRSAAT